MRALIVIALVGCAHHRGIPSPISYGPNHELLVEVNINGAPVVLQVDTGSSKTALTSATMAKLHLQIIPFSDDGHGAAGDMGKIQLVALMNTRLCGHLVRYLPGAVVDVDSGNGSIDGVLGMDVLGRYATEIDLGRNQLSLHRKQDDAWRSGDLVGIAYAQTDSGQILVDVMLDGRPVRAILDVGANRSFASPAASPAGIDVARVITEAVGADGHSTRFRAMPKVPMAVGGIAMVVPSLLVAELPIFQRLVGTGPAMIIGADVLDGRRIVIDPEDRRVYLSRR
jgi:predicted aspartyl protease